MVDSMLDREIVKPLARLLARLNQRQFNEAIVGTKLIDLLDEQYLDEFAIYRQLLYLVEQNEDIDFIITISQNIKNTRDKFGLSENLVTQLGRIDDAVIQYISTVSKRQKPYVFVLLPFRQEFFSVYEKAVRAEFEDLGCRVAHADDDTRGEKIQTSVVDFVFKQIDQAAFLVADTTGLNPNVFYELGYAHSKGKTVFILTQDSDSIPPFNVRHWHHFFYKPNALNALRTDLRKYAEPLVREYKKKQIL